MIFLSSFLSTRHPSKRSSGNLPSRCSNLCAETKGKRHTFCVFRGPGLIESSKTDWIERSPAVRIVTPRVAGHSITFPSDRRYCFEFHEFSFCVTPHNESCTHHPGARRHYLRIDSNSTIANVARSLYLFR